MNVNKQAVGSNTAAADLEEILWGGSKEQINNFEEDDFNEPLGLGDDVDLDNVAVTNLQDVLGNYNIAWSEIRILKSSCNFKLFFHKSCRLNVQIGFLKNHNNLHHVWIRQYAQLFALG